MAAKNGLRQLQIVICAAAISSQAAAQTDGGSTQPPPSENGDEPKKGCAPIEPDDEGHFQIIGSCAFFPTWKPGAALDIYDAKVLGQLNSELFELTEGKVRLLAPLDQSEVALRVEGEAGEMTYEVITEGETHVFLNKNGSEVVVVAVRGRTIVRRSYDDPLTLPEGEGRSFPLELPPEGCTLSSLEREGSPSSDGGFLFFLLILAYAGRKTVRALQRGKKAKRHTRKPP